MKGIVIAASCGVAATAIGFSAATYLDVKNVVVVGLGLSFGSYLAVVWGLRKAGFIKVRGIDKNRRLCDLYSSKHTYQYKAAKRHLERKPVAIIGEAGTGVEHILLRLYSDSKTMSITVKNVNKFVTSGGNTFDLLQAHSQGMQVIIRAQNFQELDSSGLDYRQFKLLSV